MMFKERQVILLMNGEIEIIKDVVEIEGLYEVGSGDPIYWLNCVNDTYTDNDVKKILGELK